MADDDEDVRDGPVPEDLLGPTGPRRSNFTPAPTDVDSLEAANNVFNDDAIAAALAAELARVASTPIPVPKPASPPEPVVPEPSPEPPIPEPSAEWTAPEPVSASPEPVVSTPDVSTPVPVAEQPVGPAPGPERAPEPEPEPQPEPQPQSEPEPPIRPSTPPVAPPGPPDWASSLFGQPTPTVRDESAAPVQDPFAPSAPPFAPSSGPFPPPSEADAAGTSPTTDADALRALYRGAPAPTVPPADAPPPPGYEPPVSNSDDASGGPSADARPRRRSLADDDFLRAVSDGTEPADTLSVIEQLQAQLHLREQEAREFAAWESSMQAIGTPEALAEVARARAELSGDTPDASADDTIAPPPPDDEPVIVLPPPVDEPVTVLPPPVDEQQPAAFLPPVDEPSAVFAPPVDEPIAILPPPVDEPSAVLPPPEDEPTAVLPPPEDEPTAVLPPPEDEPTAVLPPPEDEPTAVLPPPKDEPTAVLPPPEDEPIAELPPPVEDPYFIPASTNPEPPVDRVPSVDLAPPVDQAPLGEGGFPPAPPSDEPFATLAPPMEESPTGSAPAPWDINSPPATDEPPFPGFAPPTTEGPVDMYAAPADPRDLSFDLPPVLPDSPVFIEPPALVEPAGTNPTDGVADLYRSAGEIPSPASAPGPASPPAAPAEPPPETAPPAIPGGFDDLLSGSPDDVPPIPGPVWSSPEPDAPTQTTEDDSGGRRPFGEGVDRDDAVDPSDSIFGAAPGPVSVNTAGVAVLAEDVTIASLPARALVPGSELDSGEPVAVTPPRIVPAEAVGLEPTPIEQRVGRSARLFWLWFAANSSIAAIIFGTVIFGLGVSLRQAIVATLAGVALSFIPLGLGTLAGKRSGQPTMVISRATFGVVGNILPALLALFSRLFWAAGLLWILGAGTADILVGARLTDGFTSAELTLIVMAVGFVITVVIAYFGYALIAMVQLVISIISGVAIIGFIALTAQYVNIGTALTTGDGSWILVVTGAVLVFSFVGLAWANSSADVARYQRPGSSGAASMLWATFGAALPSFVLICYGALLAASNPALAQNIAANPLDSLGRLLPVWYPAPLLVATGLSLVSGVVLAMYSGGFALQATGLRLKRSLSTLLVGALVVLIAVFIASSVTDFSQLIRDFSTTIAVPVAAWAGIFGSEIMIRNRRFDAPSLLTRGGVYADVRWGNLATLVVVSVIGLGFLSATVPALGWEGYLFEVLGVPLKSEVATSDFGVLVALALGILIPAIIGVPAIRNQERAERPAE
jgi:purine-cytosine permease-like protein